MLTTRVGETSRTSINIRRPSNPKNHHCQVSLLLVAIQQKEALGQDHDGHGLYGDYHGEYAGAFDNYVSRPYSFGYGVSDPHTGDHKSHWEMKDETGVVRGSYSLLESDGSTRTVDYVADHSGFRAVVKKIGSHGNVYSIENHGSVPENSPSALHGTDADILQQQVLTEQSPVETVPLYQSYNGEIKNYQTGTSEVQNQLPQFGSYYLETPAENAYHATGSNSDDIRELEPSGGVQEPSGGVQNTLYEHYGIELPKTVETHQERATYEAKSYEQPLKSNTEWLQYPTYINSPVNTVNDNEYHSHEQVYGIHRSPLQEIWETQSVHQNQLELQPHMSLDSRSYGSNVVLHPHGESSQSFYSRTGNNQDDSEYTD